MGEKEKTKERGDTRRTSQWRPDGRRNNTVTTVSNVAQSVVLGGEVWKQKLGNVFVYYLAGSFRSVPDDILSLFWGVAVARADVIK